MAEANLGIKPHGAIVDDVFRVGHRTSPKASAGLGAAWALPGQSARPRSIRPTPSRAAASHYLSSRYVLTGLSIWARYLSSESGGARSCAPFISIGGAIIDSSPIYGISEEVSGHCLA